MIEQLERKVITGRNLIKRGFIIVEGNETAYRLFPLCNPKFLIIYANWGGDSWYRERITKIVNLGRMTL